MFAKLPEGTPLVIRAIRPDDKELLARGITELSDRTVHRRFLSPKRSFSGSELRYLTEVDGHDHVAFVAQHPSEPEGLVGVARFVRLAEDPHAAEAAIVVADCWQGRGVGSLLARALADAARAHDIHRFSATILSDNRPAQRLMAKLTDHLEQRHTGAGSAELVADLAA